MPRTLDIHPQIRAFVDRLAEVPAATTLAQERSGWREFCLANNPPRPPGMQVQDLRLTLDGRMLAARVYRPVDVVRAPCILYLHGGGWVLGDLDTQDAIAWGLAEGCRATVVSLEYRLAPEHPYPAAFDDSYETLQLLVGHAGDFAIDPARIALCGDSAGGNLCAAVTLAARDRSGPLVAAQCLAYPVVDTDIDRPSYLQNADAPMLTRTEMVHYLDAWLGDARDAPPAYAMPLRAASLAGLPPTLVHTAELDPLRDEGYRFYERLVADGTPARYRCARRMVHSFMRARFAGPAPAAEFACMCSFLREHLD